MRVLGQQSHRVIVKEEERTDSTARQHFGCNASNTANANNCNAFLPDGLIILDDAHPLKSHEPAVWI